MERPFVQAYTRNASRPSSYNLSKHMTSGVIPDLWGVVEFTGEPVTWSFPLI